MLSLWGVWPVAAPVALVVFAVVWCAGLVLLMRAGYARVQLIEAGQTIRSQSADWMMGWVLAPLASFGVWWLFGASLIALATLILCLYLWVLSVIDARTGYLPDVLTLPLVWMGLLINLQGGLAALEDAVLGAVAGYLSLWLIATVFVRVTGRSGLGRGDLKLLSALGAWFGLAALPPILLLASTGGLAVALVWRITGKLRAGQPFGFGPFLAASGVFYLYWAYH